jgi:hypothetical protein
MTPAELIDKGLILPPVEWHLGNMGQIVNQLGALQCPWLTVYALPLSGIQDVYSKFVNCYDKAERKELLLELNTRTQGLIQNINQFDEHLYALCCQPAYDYLHAQREIQRLENPGMGEYISFSEYMRRSLTLIYALRDFAGGLIAATKQDNPEPEANLYNNLA